MVAARHPRVSYTVWDPAGERGGGASTTNEMCVARRAGGRAGGMRSMHWRRGRTAALGHASLKGMLLHRVHPEPQVGSEVILSFKAEADPPGFHTATGREQGLQSRRLPQLHRAPRICALQKFLDTTPGMYWE